MRSRNENYKALRIPFYFRPGWPALSLARFSKRKQNKWRPFPIDPKKS
jgi:hypothetical protein